MLLGLVYLGVATYFAGKEIFGPNAWHMPSISWAGYLIAAPLMGGMSFLGFLLGKKANTIRTAVRFSCRNEKVNLESSGNTQQAAPMGTISTT